MHSVRSSPDWCGPTHSWHLSQLPQTVVWGWALFSQKSFVCSFPHRTPMGLIWVRFTCILNIPQQIHHPKYFEQSYGLIIQNYILVSCSTYFIQNIFAYLYLFSARWLCEGVAWNSISWRWHFYQKLGRNCRYPRHGVPPYFVRASRVVRIRVIFCMGMKIVQKKKSFIRRKMTIKNHFESHRS